MKKLLTALGMLMLLSIAAFGVAGAADTHPVAQSGPVPPTPLGMPTVPADKMQERPLPQVPHNPTAWGVPAIKAPVTETAVREYMARRGSNMPGMTAIQTPTIVSVEFMTVAQLRKRTASPNNLSYYAETAPVVYVTLAGQFSVPEPAIQVDGAFMVFDAKTGNLLEVSTIN